MVRRIRMTGLCSALRQGPFRDSSELTACPPTCFRLLQIWFSAYIMWAVFDSAAGFSLSARSLLSLVGLFSTLIVLTNH